MKFSKEKWKEIKLDWQRYGGEYIALMFCGLLFLTVVWFFVICPIMSYFHENEITTGWLYNSQNPDGSPALMAVVFPVLVNSLLMSTAFQLYHWYKKGKKFEIKVQFKSAK